MIPPHNSLVKYNNPILVSTTNETKRKAKGKKGGKQLPPVSEKQVTQTEDVLNSILPPRSVAKSSKQQRRSLGRILTAAALCACTGNGQRRASFGCSMSQALLQLALT